MNAIRTLLCSLVVCALTTTQCGNGSSVGTGMVVGKLFEPDGKTPANGAVVSVRPRNETAKISGGATKTAATLYTTVTDGSGHFAFDTIVNGEFVIEGRDNAGNLALYDSVHIDETVDLLRLPDDTLKPPGAIGGTIKLQSGGSPRQVFVLAFGVDRFCQANDDGTFLFTELAEGAYRLKIVSLDKGYLPLDTSDVVVESGDTTRLGTVVLPSNMRLPVPTNLGVAYDTLTMTAKISWDAPTGAATKGYNVYRLYIDEKQEWADADSMLHQTVFETKITPRMISGCSVVDDSLHTSYSYNPSTSAVAWAVTAIDTNGNEGGRAFTERTEPVCNWAVVDSYSVHLPDSTPREQQFDRKGNLWIVESGTMTLFCFNGKGAIIGQFNNAPGSGIDYQLLPSFDREDGIGLLSQSQQSDPFSIVLSYEYLQPVGTRIHLVTFKVNSPQEYQNRAEVHMVSRDRLYGCFAKEQVGNLQMLQLPDSSVTTLFDYAALGRYYSGLYTRTPEGAIVLLDDTAATAGNERLYCRELTERNGTMQLSPERALRFPQISGLSSEIEYLTSSDTVDIFKDRYSRRRQDGTIEIGVMPPCGIFDRISIRDDGALLVARRSSDETVYVYQLRK